MGDLFGLGGVATDLRTALETVAGTIIVIVLVVGVILMATKHKSGSGFVVTGLVALFLLAIVVGPLPTYLHAHIHG